MPAKITTSEFIERAKSVHGDRYDYSKTFITSMVKNTTITCPIHGDFETRAANHLLGVGCSECSGNKKLTTESFIKKAHLVHGDRYDYSKVNYVGAKTKVVIICKEHGEFEQEPTNHLMGSGCIKCAGIHKSNTVEFVTRAKLVHGNKYDYSKVNYSTTNEKVSIICSTHGEFKQTPYGHLSGLGCKKCGYKITADSTKISLSEFIERAVSVHNNAYDYSLVRYDTTKDKIKIRCNKHGVFEQECDSHLQGHGCPTCGSQMSKGENEICELLESLNIPYHRRDRSLIKPLELDIVIPSHNLAIEFNGLIWHSELYGKDKTYHINKTKLCNDAGFRLVHIWEDDWRDRKDIEIAFLKSILGKSDTKRVYARQCDVQFVENVDAKIFLEKNHIQGHVPFSKAVGLYHHNELVALTTFTKRNEDYELTRHVTSCNVIGSLGKAVKFFGEDVYTFCDNARFTGESYIKAGFIKFDKIAPDYKYLVNNTREHKFLWRREAIRRKRPDVYSDDLSEREMMLKAEYPRIWDCGKTRYVYKNERGRNEKYKR
jgi:hypothetical protein